MPEFGRVEYLTRVGWVVGHAGTSLSDPEKYVTGLGKDRVSQGETKPGVIARFVPMDDRGEYYTPVYPVGVTIPPFHEANPSTVAPMQRVSECAACSKPHQRPWECLI